MPLKHKNERKYLRMSVKQTESAIMTGTCLVCARDRFGNFLWEISKENELFTSIRYIVRPGRVFILALVDYDSVSSDLT